VPRPARIPARLPALLAALAAVLATAGCGLFGDSGPQDTVKAFLQAWTGGDDAGAAARTDNPGQARPALVAARAALRPAGITGDVAQVRTAGERSSASVNVIWDLGQDRRWSYLLTLDLRPDDRADTGWSVHWAPSVLHPDLQAAQSLALRTTTPDPAPVTDRNGSPLLSATPVVTVLLDKAAAGDLNALAGTLARSLGPIDPEITAQSITDGANATPAGQTYTVAVLREPDYNSVKAAIHELPGLRFAASTRLLGPDADFASQVLPAVRAQVAAQVNGKDGWEVDAVDARGTVQKTLTEVPVTPGTTAQISLDRGIQAAAEDAVNALPNQTVVVAVQPSTGDILAAAQNRAADAAGAISFTGRYPPGSTFKIVTANSALQSGTTSSTPEPCPGTTTIGGRVVPNENRFALGTVPLSTAFAKSCNTTFATLASGMAVDALPTSGLQLGFGADYAVAGLTTVTGAVPPSNDLVQRAEDGFGQGQVVATPFGMALVAATVAHGSPVVPQLIRGQQTRTTTAATAPNAAALDQLRPMMRQVVTDGTATGLRGSGEVFGKTGTAEFSQNGTNRAHGWFVGYRQDVAFAVLVVDGGSSGPAVGIAQRFLAGF
jgi:cell division protein FtsI/penicillin-binding protein 2